MRITNAFCFAVVFVFSLLSQVNADCGGVQAVASCGGARSAPMRTPVRSFVASRPLRTLGCGLFQKIGSRSAAQSCGGSVAQSCSGSMAVPAGCAGSTIVPQSVPTPVPAPSIESVQTPVCANGTCSLAESQKSFATPVRSLVSNTYQQALASAQYRAANRIHGHSYLDTHRTSGVGWATGNPKPNTCLGGDNGSTYAVVQGADGWYATKFQ